MSDEELACFAYEWFRQHNSGNGYEAHYGMSDVTLDGNYDLVAFVAALRPHFQPASDATND